MKHKHSLEFSWALQRQASFWPITSSLAARFSFWMMHLSAGAGVWQFHPGPPTASSASPQLGELTPRLERSNPRPALQPARNPWECILPLRGPIDQGPFPKHWAWDKVESDLRAAAIHGPRTHATKAMQCQHTMFGAGLQAEKEENARELPPHPTSRPIPIHSFHCPTGRHT